ncbi:S-adenosylmethionine mitochondrial carrier protein homolog [Eumeta japonica]|uniref:S-adenosylmethionine mitochondrial carrier protein homolog n=1 Tax=Eumeta variegata TaxID=151549 RepID=A0A4C1VNN0_EUMVA|nr:S-adenosylmethionine mitochondrial carrier protein homolog [Eumeta japonica]
MPTSALFFASYEFTKNSIQPRVHQNYAPLVHMFAASIGEVLACVVRVPMEIAKQRKQTYIGTQKRSILSILVECCTLAPLGTCLVCLKDNPPLERLWFQAYKVEGVRRGLYRGFLSTVVRDLPFSFIELPLWELFKRYVREHNDGQINSFQSALCGSLAGSIAAAVTTPLDLAKTRIMLAEDYAATRKLKVGPVLHTIYLESGLRGLFAGFLPRITAFGLGGFVFFGAYEYAKALCINFVENR